MSHIRAYSIGLAFSLLLTGAAFGLMWWYGGAQHVLFSPQVAGVVLMVFAVAQIFVQCVFFLHLGGEGKPWWNAQLLFLTGFIVIVVVGGTLWIMQNLSYTHEPTNIFEKENISPETYE